MFCLMQIILNLGIKNVYINYLIIKFSKIKKYIVYKHIDRYIHDPIKNKIDSVKLINRNHNESVKNSFLLHNNGLIKFRSNTQI